MHSLDLVKHSSIICWKDLLEFSRSKIRLIMLILMPLFMMLMVGFVFPSGDAIQDQPVAYANLDTGGVMDMNSTFSMNSTDSMNVSYGEMFIIQLTAMNERTHMMKLTHSSGFDNIKKRIQNGELSGGMIIPENFTASILDGKQGNIMVITDQSNPQISMMIQGALSATIEAMGTGMARQTLNGSYNVPMNSTIAVLKPYNTQFTGIVEGDYNYFEFVAPGIMSMVVMMSLMTGLPHAISYEKDIGTLDGMLVAPISRMSIILGKVMAQTIRGLFQGAIILLMAILLFGVVINGNILLVFLLMLLTVFSFVGLGILITSFVDKEETATMVMMTVMFPMMFLSGVFYPIQQMPWFMQIISRFLPLTYSTTALRKVIVLGAGPGAVLTEMAVLFGFGAVMLIVAIPLFKRAMSK